MATSNYNTSVRYMLAVLAFVFLQLGFALKHRIQKGLGK